MPVETIVATELAASWKPLRKSKTSAIAMMAMTVTRTVSMGCSRTPTAAVWAYWFFRVIRSRTMAMSSAASVAASRVSMISFALMTKIGSRPESKMRTTASR